MKSFRCIRRFSMGDMPRVFDSDIVSIDLIFVIFSIPLAVEMITERAGSAEHVALPFPGIEQEGHIDIICHCDFLIPLGYQKFYFLLTLRSKKEGLCTRSPNTCICVFREFASVIDFFFF